MDRSPVGGVEGQTLPVRVFTKAPFERVSRTIATIVAGAVATDAAPAALPASRTMARSGSGPASHRGSRAVDMPRNRMPRMEPVGPGPR